MFLIKKFDNNINLQKDTENLNPIYNKLISLRFVKLKLVI